MIAVQGVGGKLFMLLRNALDTNGEGVGGDTVGTFWKFGYKTPKCTDKKYVASASETYYFQDSKYICII